MIPKIETNVGPDYSLVLCGSKTKKKNRQKERKRRKENQFDATLEVDLILAYPL